MADRKNSSAAKRQDRKWFVSDAVISAVVGIFAISASVLQLFSLEHLFDTTTGKTIIGALSGIAGTLTGYLIARRKQRKGDD